MLVQRVARRKIIRRERLGDPYERVALGRIQLVDSLISRSMRLYLAWPRELIPSRRQQPLYERLPLGVERGPVKAASGSLIPIIGIRGCPFLAVKVGVDGHTICSLELINLRVGASPISLGVPPQRRERGG